MQQFGRILTEHGVVPVMFDRNQPLDLRTLVSDITPDVIASGALADVDTAHLSRSTVPSPTLPRSTASARSRPPASITGSTSRNST